VDKAKAAADFKRARLCIDLPFPNSLLKRAISGPLRMKNRPSGAKVCARELAVELLSRLDGWFFKNKNSKSAPLRGVASQQVSPNVQFSRMH
jgi:hypothetical protein